MDVSTHIMKKEATLINVKIYRIYAVLCGDELWTYAPTAAKANDEVSRCITVHHESGATYYEGDDISVRTYDLPAYHIERWIQDDFDPAGYEVVACRNFSHDEFYGAKYYEDHDRYEK